MDEGFTCPLFVLEDCFEKKEAKRLQKTIVLDIIYAGDRYLR
jgi:hypothetical protein